MPGPWSRIVGVGREPWTRRDELFFVGVKKFVAFWSWIG